jgi:PilZ domain
MSNVAVPSFGASTLSFSPRKILARVLLAGVDDPTSAVLRECFKQYGIQTVGSQKDAEQRLQKEKFEACVVPLGQPQAESVLSAARSSASNSRIVIYGISRDLQETMRFTKFGINVVIDDPVDRQAAMKMVRSTHLLVVHELRRYVRLPVATEVRVDYPQGSFRAVSVEISAGGLSMKTEIRLAKDQAVEVSFTLPPKGKQVTSRATVCWKREAADLTGIHFDPTDERRLEVKRWIDSYLEVG